MRQDERLDPGGRRDSPDLFNRRVAGQKVRLQGLGVPLGHDQRLQRRKIHDLVHQHVRAPGQGHQSLTRTRVARNDDGPVRTVESIGEGGREARMLDQRGRHGHVRVAHHRTTDRDLMRPDEVGQGPSAFVGDPGADIDVVHLQEQLRHTLQGRRAVGVDRCRKARRPAQQQQIPIVGVVVGVVVGQKDAPKRLERHAGEHELTGDPVPTVNDVGVATDHNHLSGRGSASLRRRPSAGPEENEPGLTHRRRLSDGGSGCGPPDCGLQRNAAGQLRFISVWPLRHGLPPERPATGVCARP